ncbi:hypothetical protein FRZ67_13680 [Panacibacter ginsenosidivorans]|uniref:Type IX secretion system membrane protein PorP/SprF n=1 Tax=Panacibacter ginsenosidivorans TaxID=1813871 RepID=A0A5B8VAK4_9BACT|nr:hypothetical protein [Panacibacter ginsenosidivorans]QEC68299.1 hypothetical protein FRZ67_13680 [Panacibacter ginsenosidivorans]
MRTMMVLMVLLVSATLNAQTSLPSGFMDYTQRQSFVHNIHLNDSTHNKKWFLSRYSGISTSFSFFKGGNATVVAAPMGLQLNRKLNNNLYVFAGVSVAPAYVNFNSTFLASNTGKFYSNNAVFKSNSFDMYSRAEMGLMYVNDQKTFSISGSIGIERSSYTVYPYNQMNTARQNPFIAPN